MATSKKVNPSFQSGGNNELMVVLQYATYHEKNNKTATVLQLLLLIACLEIICMGKTNITVL